MLHVLPSLDQVMGGTIRAALDMAEHTRRAGHHVEVVGTHDDGDDLAHLTTTYPEVAHHLERRRQPKHSFWSPALARWLDGNVARFDVVHVNGLWYFPPLYAAVACRHRRVPYVVEPHGQLDPYDLRKHAGAKRVVGPVLWRSVVTGASAMVLTAEEEEAELVRYGRPIPTHVVPLPVVPAGPGDGARFRAASGFGPADRLVLFLGRLDPKKGIEHLLRAHATLDPGVTLLLAGSGEPAYEAHLRGLADELGVASSVRWLGFVGGEAKCDLLDAADVFALASEFENFGIAVVEAMHAGVPLLLSSRVYIAGSVRGCAGARVVEPRAEAVARGLRELLALDPPQRRAAAAELRQLATTTFDPTVATERLLEVYEGVLTRPQGRGAPTVPGG